jgi:DNA repair exonuclease SbcCD ATPase subunit
MIIIERLKVENWCQHTLRSIDFVPGVNGITGPNGSGKTNLLKAICFAIRGSKVRSVAGSVNKNATEATVELELYDTDSPNLRWRIVRKITRDPATGVESQGDAELHSLGAKSGVMRGKPTNIDDKLAELINVDNVAFDNHIYIGQTKTSDIVTDPHKTRIKSLSTAIPLLLELQKKRARFDALKSKLITSTVIGDPIAAQAEITALMEQISSSKVELVLLQSEIDRTDKKRLYDQVSTAGLSALVINIQKEQAKKEGCLGELAVHSEMVTKLQAQLDAIKKVNTDPELVELYDLETLQLKPPVTVTAELVAAVQYETSNRISAIERVASTPDGQIPGYTTLRPDGLLQCGYCGSNVTRAAMEQHIIDCKQMTGTRCVCAKKNHEAVSAAIRRMNAALTLDQEVNVRRTAIDKELSRAQFSENSARKNLASVTATLQELEAEYKAKVNPVAAKAAEDALKKFEAIERKAIELGSDIRNMQEQLPPKIEALTKLKADIAASADVQRKYSLLSRAKDVLEMEQVPYDILLAYLPTITKAINQYLEGFEAPFTLNLTKDRSDFEVRFKASGNVMPLDKLSGGQSIITGLAFRLALHDHVAKQFGVMLLDEPTAYLDADAVTCVRNVFQAADAVAKKNKRQIILITHEEGLSSGIQNKIQLPIAAI